jgi:hypothetical protein
MHRSLIVVCVGTIVSSKQKHTTGNVDTVDIVNDGTSIVG